MQKQTTILEQCRDKLRDIIAAHNLNEVELQVTAKALTPEEAIGTPERRDFPIIEGKEHMIEALALGARGQAFTDSPSEFIGRIADVLDLPLDSNRNRALFVATLNAILQHLNLAEGTIHCKDDDPEKCALEIAAYARKSGARSVGLIGLNPAIAEALIGEFGTESVQILDLNRQNIGKRKFNVEILDGRTKTENVIRSSNMILVTGTTLVNGTFDDLWNYAKDDGKTLVIYGVTSAGVCELMNLTRICPCARN
ncbi:MAG: DUF364 domain-containing protein [Candidatus Hatepunaea meridiana]|nr:DUF364 domain-containing protein [Candidatus Hatepunaea meridiana]